MKDQSIQSNQVIPIQMIIYCWSMIVLHSFMVFLLLLYQNIVSNPIFCMGSILSVWGLVASSIVMHRGEFKLYPTLEWIRLLIEMGFVWWLLK